MNEFKTPVLSPEDVAIEAEVQCLENRMSDLRTERATLNKCESEIISLILEVVPDLSQLGHTSTLTYILARQKEISAELKAIADLLNPPPSGCLYTSDECSAAIVEEWNHDAIKEVERLRAELAPYDDMYDAHGWFGNLTEKVAVIEQELQEAIQWRDRCQRSLDHNPKSGWVPF